MQIQISGILKFLGEYDPTRLQALRDRYPSAAAALRPVGAVLGDSDLDIAISATKELLNSVTSTALDAASQTGRKLRSASKLDLVGGILALASTAGVVGVALGDQSALKTASLGLIGFLSSALPLFSRWLRSGVSGEVIAPAFQQLSRTAWDAQALQAEIDRLSSKDTAKLEDAVRRANELSKAAFLALTELGYTPNFKPV
jgi:hypothetical protein